MIVLWFSKDYYWYKNFKNYYESSLNIKIFELQQRRGGLSIKTNRFDNNDVNLYCENENYLEVGDSIVKKSKSTEINIFKKVHGKWIYSKKTFINKDLDFYSLIVENNKIEK